MGRFRELLLGIPSPVVDFAAAQDEAGPRLSQEPGAGFAVDAESIDPAVFGLTAYSSPVARAPRIDRPTAIQVPAVKRTRDLIAGTLGGLPLDLIGPGRITVASSLFEQPEKNVPRSVTMTRLVEDLLFEQIAWWKVLEIGWHKYPTQVKRLTPRSVEVNEDTGKVYVNGKETPDSELIRFDSPNDGLLIAGARAIRAALHLDAAAARYSEEPMPLGYFEPREGADPAEDDEIVELLDAWAASRQARATGYVPAALKYNPVQFNPKDMQLADARQHAVLEIARVAGVDPEDLGVSTTSRTYANAETRRRDLLDFTLAAYVNAIQDRLTMGDVTPRGYYARLNLNAFLRSDTKTRYESYVNGLATGAITREEIRENEDKPPLTPGEVADTTEENNVRTLPTVAAAAPPPAIQFDGGPALRLDAPQSPAAFSVDVEKRIIRGLAVPFGVTGRSNGQNFQFGPGTLKFADPSRVKLWIQHDRNRAVGVARVLEERPASGDQPAGLYAEFSVARGAEGDQALSLAEDGVLDGLSIGLGAGGRFQTRDGVNFALQADPPPLMEISLTPAPSFDDARVHQVAASAAGDGGPGAGDFAQIGVEVRKAIQTAFGSDLSFPQGPAQVGAGERLEVKEALPYRFDGVPSEHSFTSDLRSMASGDSEARTRLDGFMEEAFAVTSGNVSALNPTQNRPELYVPNLEYTRPLWDLVSKGTVTDKTPFTVPKFASAAGLVGAHTEGVEPTPGSFTATNQTITPAPVSGKIEINREVWDQGGSPQADAIIWREMLNGYFEAIEAKIATMLNGLSLTEINFASAVDNALVTAVQNVFIDLQYVRGGNRYTALALDGLFFKALVNAKDSSGRPLLPIITPENANGQTASNFARVAIGAQAGVAAWALGAANVSNSYLFVPGSVWAWASPPKRFTFEYQVKSVDMAVWGYTASAVTRDTDVKRLDYTTADV